MKSEDEIIKLKDKMRKEMKIIRSSISIEDRKRKSDKVFDILVNNQKFKEASVIMSFMSFADEIDTAKINEYIISSGKTLVLPKVMSKTCIAPIEYSGKFSLSRLGIKEPVGDVFQKKIDIIIVPALAYDTNNFRLGYGGGYYDRFLEKHDKAFCIGICFSEQLVEKVFKDEHDKKVEIVIHA